MLTIPDGRYELTKLYCLEEILIFYSAYIYTLKQAPFSRVFTNPRDIIIDVPEKRKWEEAAQRDKFLEQYQNNKLELALDIKDNGIYFPFSALQTQNGLQVVEGMHRIEAIKMYIDCGGEWNHDLFTFVVPNTFYEEVNFNPYNKQIFFPIFNIENNWHKDLFGKHFQVDSFNKERYELVKRDQPLLINVYTEQEYITTLFIWHKFLRHIIFKYYDTHNEKIPVSRYLNSNREDIINAF